jgi:hypothetical protein
MEMMATNSPNMVRMYDIMLRDDTVLAVIANCNRTYIAVHAHKLQHHSLIRGMFTAAEKKMLTTTLFKQPIKVDHYRHIGWIKTYQKHKELYTFPYRLIQNINTGELPDFPGVKLECTAKADPEVSIYKKLITTDYTAVYQDAITGDLHYIK